MLDVLNAIHMACVSRLWFTLKEHSGCLTPTSYLCDHEIQRKGAQSTKFDSWDFFIQNKVARGAFQINFPSKMVSGFDSNIYFTLLGEV